MIKVIQGFEIQGVAIRWDWKGKLCLSVDIYILYAHIKYICKENIWYLLNTTETSSVWDMKLGVLYLEIISSNEGNKAL